MDGKMPDSTLEVGKPTTARAKISLRETAQLLRRHDNILIVSHLRPDGDCLGSTLGLHAVLRHLGKRVAAYNFSPITAKWDFVPGIRHVSNSLPDWPVELTVFVDCGGVTRVHDLFLPTGVTLNIDHHLTNDCYADFNYIDIDACAVGEQIHQIASELAVPLNPEIATALYLSIMTDTGGFRYSNTTARAFRIAAELVDEGVDPGAIAQAVYENRNRGEVALTAVAMQNLHYELDNKAVWSELRRADYDAAGGSEAEPEGLVGEMRAIEGVEVSMLMHETEEGWLRVGFRGKGRVDCSAIAQRLGGGGHYNASGAHLRDILFDEARPRVIETFLAGVRESLGLPAK
jgi:phosphoesterase RecJ-like protein